MGDIRPSCAVPGATATGSAARSAQIIAEGAGQTISFTGENDRRWRVAGAEAVRAPRSAPAWRSPCCDEAVAGILAVLFCHQPIPRDLRDDRGAGDRHRLLVAADDRGLWQPAGGQSGTHRATGARASRRDPQIAPSHRLPRRLGDPDSVDHADWDESDSGGERVLPDIGRRAPRATAGSQLLAVVDALQASETGRVMRPIGGRTTAPAATGPASGPRPTSSTPATRLDTLSPEGPFRGEIGRSAHDR